MVGSVVTSREFTLNHMKSSTAVEGRLQWLTISPSCAQPSAKESARLRIHTEIRVIGKTGYQKGDESVRAEFGKFKHALCCLRAWGRTQARTAQAAATGQVPLEGIAPVIPTF
jgi:hypothetical protein